MGADEKGMFHASKRFAQSRPFAFKGLLNLHLAVSGFRMRGIKR